MRYKELVERAVRNAKSHKAGDSVRWAAVADVFAVGSTMATELCKQYKLDPDEQISGVRCLGCNP